MFGYYGLFRTTRLGNCTWYVTNRDRMVVVVTESKAALFSPDDVGGFLAAIRAEVPLPINPVSTCKCASSSKVGLWVGLSVGALVLAVVAAALLYAPGPPRYTLAADSLAIHDRFYAVTLRAAEVDVDHIRVVDACQDPEWRTTMRTNGFSNSHYHSGWYRVSGGAKVRMYRADATRVVLIPAMGGGVPVLLEAADPDTFAAELRRAWRRQ